MPDYRRANQELWDRWALLHRHSSYYPIAEFRAGRCAVGEIEQSEVGDVSGKSLLHLQCHIGLDTLSWVRKGALATGVDFSPESIVAARALSEDLCISAEFICADLYELPNVLHRQFDIVYTSTGVLCWLPDLRRWAEIIAHLLKPGGMFYISEIHPLKRLLTPRVEDGRGNRIRLEYFASSAPVRVEEHGSYAEPEADVWHTAFYWSHSLGEVVTALVKSGLVLDFLHEYSSDEHPDWPVGFTIRADKAEDVLTGCM